MSKFTVAIYQIDLTYGGPEEGGWHYTSGVHAKEYPTWFGLSEEEARLLAKNWNDTIGKEENEGLPPISSVASSGRLTARVYEGSAPEYFPQERPHYE